MCISAHLVANLDCGGKAIWAMDLFFPRRGGGGRDAVKCRGARDTWHGIGIREKNEVWMHNESK